MRYAIFTAVMGCVLCSFNFFFVFRVLCYYRFVLHDTWLMSWKRSFLLNVCVFWRVVKI